jgi:hypothetical protein
MTVVTIMTITLIITTIINTTHHPHHHHHRTSPPPPPYLCVHTRQLLVQPLGCIVELLGRGGATRVADLGPLVFCDFIQFFENLPRLVLLLLPVFEFFVQKGVFGLELRLGGVGWGGGRGGIGEG